MPAESKSADQSLEDLLARIALGNRAAFEQLYQRTSASLFGICLRVLGDRAEAEDVLQEVFAALWRKADRFDAQRASAMAWLAMVARNRAIDRRRSLRRSPLTGSLDQAEEIADPAVAAPVTSQLEHDRLEGCLEQLEAQRRTLIRSAFFQALTYEELARRIDAPLGTVKSWIRRSLLQLRECLGA